MNNLPDPPPTGQLAIGDVVSGRYTIVRFIARGGMGEVYEAHDEMLRVAIALKTIRPSIATAPRALERFRREILFARSISHPNVCRIHDLGREPTRGLSYLTMELLQGESLAMRLRQIGRMTTAEVEPLAIDVASGLRAAHERGVLHRDLKAGNLQIVPGTKRERAIITDFGLANEFGFDEESTRMTSAGAVVGTLAYMSPEQVEGSDLTPASDLYSLGVVLFEALTGVMPFAGRSPMSVAAKRLHEAAPLLRQLQSDIDPAWEALVRKCLARHIDERFTSCDELLGAIASMHGSESRPSIGVRNMPTEAIVTLPTGVFEDRRKATRASGLDPPISPDPPASTQPKITRASRHARWLVVPVAIGVSVFATWWMQARRSSAVLPTATPRQLTSAVGWESEPALSPDGSLVAYTASNGKNSDIWVVDASGSGEALRLTDDPGRDRAPTWSPDGTWIYFESTRTGSSAIWRVPRLGGVASPMIDNGADPAISPDGSRIAFTRAGDDNGTVAPSLIWLATLSDPSDAAAFTAEGEGQWSHKRPRWSPDSTTLLYGDFSSVWFKPVLGRPAQRLITQEGSDSTPAWSSTGKFVFFTSTRAGTTALWRMSLPGKTVNRLTLGTGPESQPDVSRDGKRMVYTTYVENFELVLYNLASGEHVVLPERRSGYDPAFAPDGTLLMYSSIREGKTDVWTQRLHDMRPVGEPTRFTDVPGSIARLTFSPDGKWLACHRVIDGQRDIWAIPVAGGKPLQITTDPATDIQPAWSPDGQMLAFCSNRGTTENRFRLWLVRVENGRSVTEPTLVTDAVISVSFPAWSPDGTHLAYTDTGSTTLNEVFVIPADGSIPPRQLTTGAAVGQLSWDFRSDQLFVSGAWGATSLQLRQVDPHTGSTTSTQSLADFGNLDDYGAFTIATGGQVVVIVRHDARGDIWLLQADRGSF